MQIGLVLSGGGMRGVAHIGAIKAMEELGIVPTHISGTSAGAVVGALYANNIGWEGILDFFRTTQIFQGGKYAKGKPGFIDSEKFYKEFIKMLPEDDFMALDKKLFVTATDVVYGTPSIFEEGELIRPILASASFPGMFTPTKVNDHLYVDGGILNNFPVEPLLPLCDRIIGVYVNPLKKISTKDLKHSYNVLERSYKIKMAYDSIEKFKHCDLVVHPDRLDGYGTFQKQGIDEVFEIGYTNTKELLLKSSFYGTQEP